MGSSFDDSFLFTLSSTLNIEFLDNIFFSYHALELALGRFHKSLLLVHMYTKSFVQFNINWFFTLLWIDEYEFQFRSHDHLEHTCTKMWLAIGCKCASISPYQIPPLMWAHVGASLGPSFEGC
jgi:hypothetical protein